MSSLVSMQTTDILLCTNNIILTVEHTHIIIIQRTIFKTTFHIYKWRLMSKKLSPIRIKLRLFIEQHNTLGILGWFINTYSETIIKNIKIEHSSNSIFLFKIVLPVAYDTTFISYTMCVRIRYHSYSSFTSNQWSSITFDTLITPVFRACMTNNDTII